MSYFRPNIRVSEILKNSQAINVLKKYAPEIVNFDENSNYLNCSLYRIIRDDYPHVSDDIFYEMEQIVYDKRDENGEK